MIEIEEPPQTAACAACSRPLTWLWSARTRRWVAFVTTDERDTLRVDPCRHQPGSARAWQAWRTLAEQPPDVRERGLALARAALDHTHDADPQPVDAPEGAA